MNQDAKNEQARRWAEEVKLPEPDGYVAMSPNGSIIVPPRDFAKHNAYAVFTARQVREAIAAALVKLTQGQELVSPRVSPEMFAELQHNLDVVAKAHNKHIEIGHKYSLTDPAPSRQEGEIVVTKHEAGQIIAVTRQDKEGRILKVIAESSRQEDRKPLTDEQIHAASLQAGMQEHYMDFHSGFIRFARAIEAAHNIREQQ